ncbi:MAG: hypothetical protein HY348_04840 [Nitrospira defluvii]|nr:hypothetical protein [Nitrospira defluvii]
MATTLSAKELSFSIHGMRMQFATDSSALAEATSQLLHHFESDAVTNGESLRMEFAAIGRRNEVSVQPAAAATQLYSGSGIALGNGKETTWLCDIYVDQGRLLADFHEEGLIVVDGASKSVRGWIVRPEGMSPDIRMSFIHFAMTELVKRSGLYTFHATALEKNGQGVLIPGFSGRGKTTSFLSLLRSGYRYLSDDHPFFRLHGSGVEILPYPLKINVTDRTVAFFPELREAPPSVLKPGVPKRYFHVEDVYPGPLGQPCRPALILFPQVHDASYSCLEPLSKKQSLEMILPHSLLVYDPEIARSEFQALARLVAQADCYRLHFGRDVLDLPQLVTPLLEHKRTALEN